MPFAQHLSSSLIKKNMSLCAVKADGSISCMLIDNLVSKHVSLLLGSQTQMENLLWCCSYWNRNMVISTKCSSFWLHHTFDYFRCSKLWKFRQNDHIFCSVLQSPPSVMDTSSIPIVDIGPCFNRKDLAEPDVSLNVAKDLCHAFKTVGFVYVKNHGLPDSQVRQPERLFCW